MINPIIKLSIEHLADSMHTALMLRAEDIQLIIHKALHESIIEYDFVLEVKKFADQTLRNELESAVKSAIQDIFWSEKGRKSMRNIIRDIVSKTDF